MCPQSLYDEFFDSSSTVEDALSSANKYLKDKADSTDRNINEILQRVRSIQPQERTNIVNNVQAMGGTSVLGLGSHSRVSPMKSAREYQDISTQLVREIETLNDNEEKRHAEMMKYFRRVFGDEKVTSSTQSISGGGTGSLGIGKTLAGAAGALGAVAAGTGVGAAVSSVGTAIGAGVGALASTVGRALPWAGVLSLSGDTVPTPEQLESERKYMQAHPEYAETRQGRGTINKWLSDAWDWTKRHISRGEETPTIGGSLQRQKSSPSNSFMYAQMMRESGGQNIRSKTSSATGPYQIIDETYWNTVRRHRSEYEKAGLNPYDRNDPKVNEFTARLINQDNAASLRESFGRDPTYGEVDAAYFLGETDYRAMLRADPNSQVSDLFKGRKPSRNPVTQNKGFFTEGMTVGEALKKAQSRLSDFDETQPYATDPTTSVSGSITNPTLPTGQVTVPGINTVYIEDGRPSGTKKKSRPDIPKTESKIDKTSPVGPVSQADSIGRNAASVPFFLIDPGMLVTLGGMA